eukprot:502240-Pyramimonas_sp.AAC.1
MIFFTCSRVLRLTGVYTRPTLPLYTPSSTPSLHPLYTPHVPYSSLYRLGSEAPHEARYARPTPPPSTDSGSLGAQVDPYAPLDPDDPGDPKQTRPFRKGRTYRRPKPSGGGRGAPAPRWGDIPAAKLGGLTFPEFTAALKAIKAKLVRTST